MKNFNDRELRILRMGLKLYKSAVEDLQHEELTKTLIDDIDALHTYLNGKNVREEGELEEELLVEIKDTESTYDPKDDWTDELSKYDTYPLICSILGLNEKVLFANAARSWEDYWFYESRIEEYLDIHPDLEGVCREELRLLKEDINYSVYGIE